MPDIVVGSVAVDVVPSAVGFHGKTAAKVVPAAKRLGEETGRILAEKIESSIRRGMGEGFAGSSAAGKKAGSSTGQSFGGEFARTARTRIEAALRSLPNAQIGVATTRADQKLKDLRAELMSLRDAEIGIDISDAEALAKISEVQTALAVLGAESPNIQVRVDTGRALAELVAFTGAMKLVTGKGGSGGGGLSAVKSLASGAGRSIGALFVVMSSGLFIVGALATALIPLTGALLGVTAALLGPLAAAGGGLTLFGVLSGFAVKNVIETSKEIDKLKKKADGLRSGKAKNAVLADIAALENGLTRSQKAFLKAKDSLSGAFTKLINGKAGNSIFAPLTSGMNLLAKIMPALTPLIVTVSDALSEMLDSVTRKASGPGFKNFISSFSQLAGSSIKSLGSIIGGITRALGGLFKAGTGTGTSALDAMADAAQRLGNYLNSAKGQEKLKKFFDWLKKEGPGIAEDFGSIVRSIAKTLKDLEPFGRKVLDIVTAVAGYISDTFVPNIKRGITAIRDIWNGIGPAVTSATKFILEAFAWLISGFATVLRALSNVPKFGWAKTAADGMDVAAATARGLARSIDNIPKKTKVTASESGFQHVIDMANRMNRAVSASNRAKLHYSPGRGGAGGIPMNAAGTDYFQGGLTWVGERGKELVRLPEGSQIFSHDKSMAMTRSAARPVERIDAIGGPLARTDLTDATLNRLAGIILNGSQRVADGTLHLAQRSAAGTRQTQGVLR